MDKSESPKQGLNAFLRSIESSATEEWSKVTHFTMESVHFIGRDVSKRSRFKVISNNGVTVELFDGKKNFVSSFYGDDERLVAYDLRPKKRYMEVDGRFFPTPNGSVTITGYYPDYQTSDGRKVYIGPELHFFLRPQMEIDALAMKGLLLHNPFTVRFCWTCGGPIPFGAGPAARYCSEACGLHTRAARDERANQPRELTCEGCGGKFHATGSGNHRYCSDECKPRKGNEKEINCARCGKIFSHFGRGKPLYCSDECWKESVKRKRSERLGSNKPRSLSCGWCTTSFMVEGPGNHRYCSDRCKRNEGPRFPLPKGILK